MVAKRGLSPWVVGSSRAPRPTPLPTPLPCRLRSLRAPSGAQAAVRDHTPPSGMKTPLWHILSTTRAPELPRTSQKLQEGREEAAPGGDQQPAATYEYCQQAGFTARRGYFCRFHPPSSPSDCACSTAPQRERHPAVITLKHGWREIERERKRETEKCRELERQRDRKTECQREIEGKETKRQETKTEIERQTDRQTGRRVTHLAVIQGGTGAGSTSERPARSWLCLEEPQGGFSLRAHWKERHHSSPREPPCGSKQDLRAPVLQPSAHSCIHRASEPQHPAPRRWQSPPWLQIPQGMVSFTPWGLAWGAAWEGRIQAWSSWAASPTQDISSSHGPDCGALLGEQPSPFPPLPHPQGSSLWGPHL